MIDYPYPPPAWAIRLDEWLDRILYKPWMSLGFVIQPKMTHGPDERLPPEVMWSGSLCSFVFRSMDSAPWVECASVFYVPGPSVIGGAHVTTAPQVEAVGIPIAKIAFHKVIPPWILRDEGDDAARFRWLRTEIHQIECHEADEFLLLDGIARANPHDRPN